MRRWVPPHCVENRDNNTMRRWVPPHCIEKRDNNTMRRWVPPHCIENRKNKEVYAYTSSLCWKEKNRVRRWVPHATFVPPVIAGACGCCRLAVHGNEATRG